MDIVKKFVEFFKKPPEETVDKSPEETCSLCWGYQEYDGKIRKLYRDKQVDVNNHKESYLVMEKFVKDHIDGYHVKEGVIHVCPNCDELKTEKEKVKKYIPEKKD